jgi:hypothetical protein
MTMIHRTRDEAPASGFPGQYGSYTVGVPPAHFRFEGRAALTRALPSNAVDVLGILLASTFPTCGGGCEVLRPLWAEEAMHRAYGFVRLVDAREGRRDAMRSNPMIDGLDCVIARDLAARFREMEVVEEREARPCGTVLRDIVAGLGALFGRPGGVIAVLQTPRAGAGGG